MDIVKLKDVISTMPGITPQTPIADIKAWLVTPSVVRPKPYSATVRTLMADLGPTVADDILTILETAAVSNRVVARTLSLLTPAEGGIDLSHSVTRAQLDALVPAVLTQTQVDKLKALGEELVTPCVVAGYAPTDLSDQIIQNARSL